MYLYRLRLGRLLGHRFLMLIHRGRRTGRVHRTVVEVIRYDLDIQESIVISSRGDNADWYRNIQATPALEIRTGKDRYVPTQRFLTPDEAYAELADYERRHPFATRILLRTLGVEYDGFEADRRALTERFRLVAFRPKGLS